jgi:hypothetical protein
MLDFHRDDFQPDNLTPTQRQLLEARKARAARIHAAACHVESSKPAPRIVECKPRDEIPAVRLRPIVRRVETPKGNNWRCKQVQRLVAKHAKVGIRDIVGHSRCYNVTPARQLAAYLAFEFTKLSWYALGRNFGRRDHSTMFHSIAVVKQRIADNPAFAAEVESLKAQLRELFGEVG